MRSLLVFGMGSVNEYGQAVIGVYAREHPAEALVLGLGVGFLLYLLLGREKEDFRAEPTQEEPAYPREQEKTEENGGEGKK